MRKKFDVSKIEMLERSLLSKNATTERILAVIRRQTKP
jgi:hypothetical protein